MLASTTGYNGIRWRRATHMSTFAVKLHIAFGAAELAFQKVLFDLRFG
jgi:hypothetical protein